MQEKRLHSEVLETFVVRTGLDDTLMLPYNEWSH